MRAGSDIGCTEYLCERVPRHFYESDASYEKDTARHILFKESAIAAVVIE